MPLRYKLDRQSLTGLAIANRMELLEMQLQLLQDASAINWARNQTLPLATLGYTYNINGTGLARGDSFDLLTNNKFTSQRVGIQVSIPLGNEAAQSRLLQYIYTQRQSPMRDILAVTLMLTGRIQRKLYCRGGFTSFTIAPLASLRIRRASFCTSFNSAGLSIW